MTNVESDLAAAWIFAALLATVLAILDVVIQSFTLHSALARGKVHAPELAGIRLLALWLPTTAVWLGASIAVGLLKTPERCSSADWSMLWLGVLYPLTAWPAVALARKAGVRVGAGYFVMQLFPAAAFVLLGAFPCF